MPGYRRKLPGGHITKPSTREHSGRDHMTIYGNTETRLHTCLLHHYPPWRGRGERDREREREIGGEREGGGGGEGGGGRGKEREREKE